MAGKGGPSATADGRLRVETAHYYARIYGAARAGCLCELRRAGCSEEEAEDVFAATFERVMRRLDPDREGFVPAQTVTLLKQACRQKLIDERRHSGVLQLVPLSEESERCDPAAEEPAEAAERREAVAIAQEAIASLPPRDRDLFLQRHQLGLSPEEIMGRNPGLSPRTYRKIIQRANARALEAFERIGSGARCEEMRGELLGRFVGEQASDAERREVKAHLHRCRACRLEAAGMRTGLHEVAGGLAALLAQAHLRGGGPLGRVSEAVMSGVESLAGLAQALRERLRELAVKAAMALPGSGGETVGQLAGISGAKAVSVCAAGALAASCLAAGALPGVGLVGLADSQPDGARAPVPARSSEPAEERPASPASPEPAPAASSASPQRSVKGGSEEAVRPARTRSSLEANPSPQTRPTISGKQTGTEFSGDAEGTGTPAPSFSHVPPDRDASSSGALTRSRSVGGSSATGSPSTGSGTASEFGF